MAKRPGTGWEDTVREDFNFKKTANSGAVNGDGDLSHPRILIECKDERGEAIRFPYSQLIKIRQQALRHNKKHWMRFYRNGKGDKIVSMDYELATFLVNLATSGVVCPNCEGTFEFDW